MTRVFFSDDYVGSLHEFDTTRKARWIIDSLVESPLRGIDVVVPDSLDAASIMDVHDPDYVRAVQTGNPPGLARSQGFEWDAGLWRMVCSSNGGAVAAALAALRDGISGSLSSGLHHARRERGAGFCTFNGLVLAARAALAAGARSVLILDFDAHCGGGTASLIAQSPEIWQIDVSVNSFDRYTPSHRVSLQLAGYGRDYLAAVRGALRAADAVRPRFDLCIYNAGMDPYEGCPTGGSPGITRECLAERERLVFDWHRTSGVPVAFVLAGGYVGLRLDERGLVELHRLTLACAADSPPQARGALHPAPR